MIDFDIVAYAMLGLSLSVSAVQIGGWLLNASPRAILNLGRWSAVALVVLTPLVLLWLVIGNRSTLAMMLASFALPVFIEGARRWRGPLNALKNWRSGMPPRLDPDLAEQCARVLQAYLAQTGGLVERKPNGSVADNACPPMSVAAALAVLGLDANASAHEVKEAHRRLAERLDPESGGTRYLAMQIREARDVLLGA